jgi:fluoroquinolone resistance protein
MATEITDQEFTSKNSPSLEDGEFEGCRFSGIQSATLARSRFVDCTFENCDLSNALLQNSRFRDVKFENCKLIGVDWTRANDLATISFYGCNLDYANFTELNLRHLVLRASRAREAFFNQADLTEADCQESDFFKAEFSAANLTKADFRGATNYRIVPGEVKLKKTHFSLPEATALLRGLDIVLD